MANQRQRDVVRAMIPGLGDRGPYWTIEKAWDCEAEKKVSVLVAWTPNDKGQLADPKILLKLAKDPCPETLELLTETPTDEWLYRGKDHDDLLTLEEKIDIYSKSPYSTAICNDLKRQLAARKAGKK